MSNQAIRISVSLLCCTALAGLGGFAAGESAGVLQPQLLSKSYQKGEKLEDLRPWPASMVIRPLASHRFVRWYTGPELTSMIYEASDGVIRLTNLSYDEHTRVLNGTAILTSADGKVQEFHAGDTFAVPKGWNGTWEFKGGYREEITFDTNSLNEAMKSLFDK